ncbi:Leucine-rich repeat protein protein of unknown function [endosymbiont DhMRE of Dentiscutata heterogama]|uniref:hypothetical protein n=1 Tax=endosymbiont DhMRE of Dentiscutata heterogama TaxID=1609546 RepID=UPI000629DD0E|nr:hypothetical protein [endosymbiont DhMRE of Dentiscutata heterogama]CFW92970.1 Leucine-rich repeat protein protein of unknown function [endosymbiont DhMRE of Dentiscutata heterogama]
MTAQEYLAKNWSDKNIATIHLLPDKEEKKLSGELIIQDYPNLQEINLPNQELTSLIINNCPNLKRINVRNNQLSRLEFSQTPEIEQLIAGQNEFSILDLTNCPKLKELIAPDNSYLTGIKGFNLSTVINLNITNTSVNLAQDYEELKAEKERLLGVIENLKKGGEEGKLMMTEAIESSGQVEEAIQRHLQKTEKEWREYLTHPEKALPAFQVPESRQKVKKVLILIAEAQTNRNYQELYDEWNGKGEYNGENDFDCNSLKTLEDYLKVRNYFKKKEGQILLK